MNDQVAARRQQIHRELEQAEADYPDLWSRVTQAWRNSESGQYAWLTYAANYLFSIDGFKWALDPFAMSSRISGMPSPGYRRDLAPLSLIVLTHEHNDHLDMSLIAEMAQTKARWVIPSYLLEKIETIASIPHERLTIPRPGEEIVAGPLRVLPFDSLHMHGDHGVPETGYLVTFGDQRWLFPGDIRTYEYDRLPSFGRLTGVAAHLWLGKARALEVEPPLSADFCDFYTRFDTERLLISHLNEFGRDEYDLWNESHFDLVKKMIQDRNPNMRVEKALMGDRVDLS